MGDPTVEWKAVFELGMQRTALQEARDRLRAEAAELSTKICVIEARMKGTVQEGDYSAYPEVIIATEAGSYRFMEVPGDNGGYVLKPLLVEVVKLDPEEPL